MEERRKPINVLMVLFGVFGLVGIGVAIGVAIESSSNEKNKSFTAPITNASADIGNTTRGRQLFVSYGCASCHSFEGRGGRDGPALDYMHGKMSAGDIADMSGQIWNHVPEMQTFFKKEKIPFPNFKPGQMADMIAYLHGGGPPPDMSGISGHGGMGSMNGR